jgi:uncharacterized protein with HEPN domain
MSSPNDLDFLRHILEEINLIARLTSQFDAETILKDDVMQRAVRASLEVIGEASRYISSGTRNKYPDVGWRELSDTRNRIIHEYFGIDFDQIREIIQFDIPELKTQIEKIISELK